jgi:hypothetical protein
MKKLIKHLKYRARSRLYRWRADSVLTSWWNKVWISTYVRNLEGRIVLTYNADASHEGAGTQLQRMYGIYALSRFLNVPYRHTPLRHVAYQGLSALQRNVIDPDYVDRLNRVFHIDSDLDASISLDCEKANTLSPQVIKQLASQSQSKPFLLALNTPTGITEHVPDCWNVCTSVSPFSSTGIGPFRIALHVRWGDVLIADSWRILPNDFYIQVALRTADVLRGLGIPYQIELHTEVPTEESIILPEHHRTFELNHPVSVSPQMCRLHEFKVLPNFIAHINEDTITALSQLATADALVLSRSSFSFLAGILNKHGIVLYYPFWHACPSSWLKVQPNGKFDELKFLQRYQIHRTQHA